jgi:hypothetical protein
MAMLACCSALEPHDRRGACHLIHCGLSMNTNIGYIYSDI